jgi:hypothetical protein
MFIVALFETARNEINISVTNDECIKKMWHLCKMGYDSVIKRMNSYHFWQNGWKERLL